MRMVARTVLAGAVAVALGAGCGLVRPVPLGLGPGQRAVLGSVDLTRFDASEVLIAIVRDDGSFQHELYVGRGSPDFAVGLPPGRYRMPEVRIVDQRRVLPREPIRRLGATFEVGPEPAVYIGTLRLIATPVGPAQVRVVDEYDRTVAALRDRYLDIPATVARSLARPA